MRTIKSLIACACALGLSSGAFANDSSLSPPVSNTDLFQSATGTTSGDLTGIGPLFGSLTGSVLGEPDHFIFNDGGAPLRFVNFDTTGGADTVRSIRIIFGTDGNGVDRRALSFRLFADTDGNSSFETTVIPTTPIVYTLFAADIMMDLVSAVTADLFRLEVDHPLPSTFNGARIFEFDAFSTTFVTAPPPPRTGVPEPTTLLLLGAGIAALAGVRRRRGRQ